jgi:hypothetical protein
MKTILCYAFGTPHVGTIWDVTDRLAAADIGYMHDCLTGLVHVRIEDAAAAALALADAGLVSADNSGRMVSLPESDWPSTDDLPEPIAVEDIDWDPRETWCAGPPPRLSV